MRIEESLQRQPHRNPLAAKLKKPSKRVEQPQREGRTMAEKEAPDDTNSAHISVNLMA